MTKEEKDEIRKAYCEWLSQNEGCGGSATMFIVVLLLVVFTLTGCKTTEYIEVPVTHTEYVYRDRVDSLMLHDSIYIKEQVKGDTVTLTEYRYRDRYRYIYKTDTVAVLDTVSVVTPVETVKVEYKTRGIVKMLAGIGGIALWILGLFVVFKYLR